MGINADGSNATIHAVIFHGHGTPNRWWIYTDPKNKDNNATVVPAFINDLDKKEIGHLLLLGCSFGQSDRDFNPGTVNKGAANFASELALGKHIFSGGVIASSLNTRSFTDGRLFTHGSHKLYKWNYDTRNLDIFRIKGDSHTLSAASGGDTGEIFASPSALIQAAKSTTTPYRR